MAPGDLDPSLRRGEALLHEDLITPLHHHDESQNRLLATLDGQTRVVTPRQANDLVATLRPNRRVDDPTVEHVPTGPRLGRRGLFRGSLIGLGGLLAASAAPRYSFAAGTGGDLLVCIFLRGGFDGLAALGLPNDSYYGTLRGTTRVSTGLALSSDYVLNPNFSAINDIWNDGQLAVVVGSGHPDVQRSHFEDQDLCERAAKANVRSGWIGRHIASSSSASGTFRGITIGDRVVLSLTTNAYQSIAMSSVDSFTLESAWNDGDRLVTDLGAIYGDAGGVLATQAQATLTAVQSLGTVRSQAYAPANGASYPDTTWGKGLKDIARLAKADLGMEVACIDYGGWDMHQNIGRPGDADGAFSTLARDFSKGLAAFRTDLGSRWNSVTVVTMSEFGRRAEVNGDGGSDHGHGNLMFLMGGSIKGGTVYGSMPTSLSPDNLTDGDVPITTDYRQALSEIVSKRLGNSNLDQVFPGFTPGPALGVA
ncbi:MAG: DUF1501 domain-containing protein [Propionicimonas sp.]|uniref:DUF1501 domain-containing protein n=1 Tax=Propionicimonas sp. TaxID=1955623 RepID=UPI003D0D837E